MMNSDDVEETQTETQTDEKPSWFDANLKSSFSQIPHFFDFEKDSGLQDFLAFTLEFSRKE
jgi:hypothetical protein